MISLRAVTLGVAMGEVWNGVHEVGGNNMGPKVSWYLANCDPPIHIAAPWCAAAVQGCSDHAARQLRMPNPLDAVRQEALVLSYHEWATQNGIVVPAHLAEPGDLVLFDFHPGVGNPWDHIGFLEVAPGQGASFLTLEGNTGSQSQRDGDGFYEKERFTNHTYDVEFVRWAA